MSGGAPPGGRALMYTSALAGVVAMVGMWNFLAHRQTETPSLRHVVAVGSFNTAGASDTRAGVTFQAILLRRLAQYPDLLVLERLDDGNQAIEGKTEFLLDGSLRQHHPGWELAVRLRDLNEDRVLWSDAFQVAPQDLEAASDRIVRGLARTLKVHPR